MERRANFIPVFCLENHPVSIIKTEPISKIGGTKTIVKEYRFHNNESVGEYNGEQTTEGVVFNHEAHS